MAIKEFPSNWIGVYNGSNNSYYGGGSPIMVGGSQRYNTFIGIPTSVKNAINSSTTTATLKVKIVVTDGAEFDIGAHKESSNKASGTLPWYTYTGLHPILSVGTRVIDLTSAFKADYMSGKYSGIVMYGGSDYGEAWGNTGNSSAIVFQVEGTWNTAPTKPSKFLSPTVSFVGDDSVLVSWTPSADAEKPASQLTYRVRYYDGSDYINTLVTGAGQTSLTFSLSGQPETSRAHFAVRAYDGELYSPYTYSPSFTVSHNSPPAKPSQLTPSTGGVIDRTKVQRFTWKHNDSGTQAGFGLAYRKIGDPFSYLPPVQDNFFNSTNQFYDFPANFFEVGEYEWTVRTKDQKGLYSPYANYIRVTFGEQSDAPIITSPANGGVLSSSELIVEWSSLDQQAYEIKLLENGVQVWTETQTAGNKATRSTYPLTNEKGYEVEMRVLSSSSGIWSSWSSTSFTTQFVAPATPTVSIDTLNEFGESADTIQVLWVSPTPTGSQPAVSYTQVFKREYNAVEPQEWALVADQLASNGSWIDYAPASELTYEYYVRTWGGNDTFSDSAIVEGEVRFEDTFLQRALVPSDLLKLTESETRSQSISKGGSGMSFAGRVLPVWESNIHLEGVLSVTWRVFSAPEMRNALAFLKRNETFLYRDNAGRKLYCVVRDPEVEDLPVAGFDISIELYEVDYVEGGW